MMHYVQRTKNYLFIYEHAGIPVTYTSMIDYEKHS